MSRHVFKGSFIRGFRKTTPKGFLRFQGSSPSCRLYEPLTYVDEGIKKSLCVSTILRHSLTKQLWGGESRGVHGKIFDMVERQFAL
jgi:hypothetical protein